MERQLEKNGFDVQVRTGVNKKYYRVFVLFTNFLGDSPQMHSLTGVCKNACHLCMCKNFANFRINDCDEKGEKGSICEIDRPRDIKMQYGAGLRHMREMTAFINKTPGSNTREGQQQRKQTTAVLREINGYSGVNKVFRIFKLLIDEGMIQLHKN